MAEKSERKLHTVRRENTASRKMRVLIVAPTLDTMVGGQSVQAARLLEKLSLEPEMEIAIQPIAPKFLPGLQKIKFVRTVVTSLKYWFDLITKIPHYDVIHIFSAAHFSFLLAPTPAVLIAKLFGKKTILNYRAGQLEEHYANWHRTLHPTLRLFDRIVVPSKYLNEIFAKIGFQSTEIPCFINAELFTFRERNPLKPVFLSNRLLEELYNIPCILRAFRLIQDKYPNAELVVAGDGNQRESLENLARELKLENVEFVGRIGRKEMRQFYDAADIYLNAPNTDNMPTSLFECYVSGVPVVTTDAGGIPYILENEKTGLMIPIGDHEAMARAAIRLLEDEKLAAHIVKNAREYCRKFTWKAARNGWMSVYRELFAENIDKQ